MISVIILTWNSVRYIESCLQSLITTAPDRAGSLEIFIVDGGSTDGTRQILSRFSEKHGTIHVIQLEKNCGTTVSRNIAIRKTRGEFLFFLDSDTEVLPGALDTLIKVLEENPRAGIAAPRLLYPDGSVQPSCKRFPTFLLKCFKFLPVTWLQKLGEKAELYPGLVYEKDFCKILRVDHCISACWLVRKEALQNVGLLDEKIFYAPEDVDYCLRMWLSGWEVLYVPMAEVVHHTQRCSHRDLRMAWIHFKGLMHYFWKHGYWINRERVYRKIAAVATLRRIELPIGRKSSDVDTSGY